MVPFSGANAEMQRAHVQVAEEEANKMAAAHAAYCKSLQVSAFLGYNASLRCHTPLSIG